LTTILSNLYLILSMTVKNIFNGGISRKVEVNADLTVKSSWFIVPYVTTLIEKFKREIQRRQR